MIHTQKSFILYHDQRQQVEMLSDAQAGVLIKAIYRFVAGEEAPRIEDGMTQMCFSFISSQIERDAKAYDQKCKKLSENARRGGQATAACKQKQANGANCSQLQAIESINNTDTVNDTDTDTDTVSDTVTDTDTGRVTAATPSPAPAPHLTEEERERLLKKGLPARYLDEREARAVEHAASYGGDVYAVLMEWWKADRQHAPWNCSQLQQHATPQKAPREPCEEGDFHTFDTDDFFQAALRKSFAMP